VLRFSDVADWTVIEIAIRRIPGRFVPGLAIALSLASKKVSPNAMTPVAAGWSPVPSPASLDSVFTASHEYVICRGWPTWMPAG